MEEEWRFDCDSNENWIRGKGRRSNNETTKNRKKIGQVYDITKRQKKRRWMCLLRTIVFVWEQPLCVTPPEVGRDLLVCSLLLLFSSLSIVFLGQCFRGSILFVPGKAGERKCEEEKLEWSVICGDNKLCKCLSQDRTRCCLLWERWEMYQYLEDSCKVEEKNLGKRPSNLSYFGQVSVRINWGKTFFYVPLCIACDV